MQRVLQTQREIGTDVESVIETKLHGREKKGGGELSPREMVVSAAQRSEIVLLFSHQLDSAAKSDWMPPQPHRWSVDAAVATSTTAAASSAFHLVFNVDTKSRSKMN